MLWLELTEARVLLEPIPRLYWRNLALQLKRIAKVEQTAYVGTRYFPSRGA